MAWRFGLGLDAPWYLMELTAIGYVPLPAVAIFLAWLAVAGQLIALESYRYAPYPTAAERRGRGPFRTGVRRLAEQPPPLPRGRAGAAAGRPRRPLSAASAEREKANAGTGGDLALAARDVNEDVGGGRARDHVRLLPAQRRDSGQSGTVQLAIST